MVKKRKADADVAVAEVESPWKNKIVGHALVAPAELLANPLNFRVHPQAQREFLRAVIEEIGFIRSVTVNKLTGRIIDGHERVNQAKEAGQPLIEVEYVELTEEQERKALATFDAIAALAGLGDRSSLALFGDTPAEHRMVADHLTAETPVRVEAKGRTVDEWSLKPDRPDNHLFDCLVGSAVAASIEGCELKPAVLQPDNAPAKPPRRRVSYLE